MAHMSYHQYQGQVLAGLARNVDRSSYEDCPKMDPNASKGNYVDSHFWGYLAHKQG